MLSRKTVLPSLWSIRKRLFKTSFRYLLVYFCACCFLPLEGPGMDTWQSTQATAPSLFHLWNLPWLLQTEFILGSKCSDSSLAKILWLYFSCYFKVVFSKYFSYVLDYNSLQDKGCILFTFYTKYLSQDLTIKMNLIGNP